MNILIVEDDLIIGESLIPLLNSEGYNASLANNCVDALNIIKNKELDLIILDLTLPDGNGFSLFEKIKEYKSIPIIFLSALDDELSIVRGLDLGAGDYITKPFKVRELLSRIKNVLRRTDEKIQDFVIGNVVINTRLGKVTKNNHDVFLTALEYKILLILLSNHNQTLTREQILADIWDCDLAYVNDNTLTVYIKRIREKIEDDINNPTIILTIRGIGYRISL